MFVAYVFVYAFVFTAQPLSDPDFWWHLKAGEYIVKNGIIPRTDFFSFTNFGKEWVAHEWLSEAIFYLLYSWVGFSSMIVIFAIIATLAFWIAFKRFEGHPFIGGFAVLLGVWTVLPTIGVRPRVFTFLLTSIYLAILAHYARKGDGRAIWWLVPLMALWVNLHGGFLIGLVLIGLTIIGIVLDGLAIGESLSISWPRVQALSFVLLGCLVAVLLNPTGPRIYTFPFEIFFSPVQQRHVVDWLSPNFHDSDAVPLAALILITVAALALSPKRARPSDLLLFLATLYATLKSGRHLAIFALVAVPILAEYLQNWVASTSWGRPFSKPTGTTATKRGLALYALLLSMSMIPFVPKLKTVLYDPPTQEMLGVPVKAVQYIKDRQIPGNVFNEPNIWGGYLIWELPSNPVYIDGRIDMYGDEFVQEYLNVVKGIIDWRASFEHYDVRVALVKPKTLLARELQDAPDWEKVYEDEMAVAFMRR